MEARWPHGHVVRTSPDRAVRFLILAEAWAPGRGHCVVFLGKALRGEKLNYQCVAKKISKPPFFGFTQSEFLDIFYCSHVTYQIWAWFETFKGNVNQTNTVNFDAHWTSGARKKEVLRFP